MTAPDLSTLSAGGLAAELEVIAGNLARLDLPIDADLLREAARRIAPATTALADVARLETVDLDALTPEQRAAALNAAADKAFG